MRSELEIRKFRKQLVGAMRAQDRAGQRDSAEHLAILIGLVDYCLGDKEPPGFTNAEAEALEQAADAGEQLRGFELN